MVPSRKFMDHDYSSDEENEEDVRKYNPKYILSEQILNIFHKKAKQDDSKAGKL